MSANVIAKNKFQGPYKTRYLQGRELHRELLHYNRELSRKRTLSVRNFLNAQGVAPERLTVSAYGESRPIVGGGSAEKQAVNRRVEFVSRTME
jgi:flagellar motor protein MotB